MKQHKKLLHQLFEERVAISQDNMAVIAPERKFTYGELSKASNQVAKMLLNLGAKKIH